jgi:hypothetical protein
MWRNIEDDDEAAHRLGDALRNTQDEAARTQDVPVHNMDEAEIPH